MFFIRLPKETNALASWQKNKQLIYCVTNLSLLENCLFGEKIYFKDTKFSVDSPLFKAVFWQKSYTFTTRNDIYKKIAIFCF